jgi:hypothetical protein
MSRRYSILLLSLFVFAPVTYARDGVPRNGPVTTLETEHLTVVAAVSHESVAPGERFSLVFDITPRRGVQVYAPGRHTYRIVRFTLDPQSWLDEFVEVYQRAFTLVQDVSVTQSPQLGDAVVATSSVRLSGRLEYQACDDKLCYMPKTVPVTWTLDWRAH